MLDEEPDFTQKYEYVDPQKPWKKNAFEGCTIKELQEPVMIDDKRVKDSPSLIEIRNYVKNQLKYEIWSSEQRFENPHVHYLDMSKRYYDLKLQLLEENK